jgi:4-hydroxy-2-oxoheptanedioate aldolase
MGVDAGAHGIIVPYVETVEQVKAMVGAVKYRPLKGAALEAVLNKGRFPSEATAAYLPEFNCDAVLVIMIESPAGIANLPQMLAFGGVDAVLMGPHDISISHGVPEQYDHPTFIEAVKNVIDICQEYDVGVGIHFISGTVENAAEWAEWGCNMISHRGDTLFIARGIQEELHFLRRRLDGVTTESVVDDIGKSGHSV